MAFGRPLVVTGWLVSPSVKPFVAFAPAPLGGYWSNNQHMRQLK